MVNFHFFLNLIILHQPHINYQNEKCPCWVRNQKTTLVTDAQFVKGYLLSICSKSCATLHRRQGWAIHRHLPFGSAHSNLGQTWRWYRQEEHTVRNCLMHNKQFSFSFIMKNIKWVRKKQNTDFLKLWFWNCSQINENFNF